MEKTKIFLLFLLFCVGFICENEAFIYELSESAPQNCKLAEVIFENDEEKNAFLNEIEELSFKNEVAVYFVDYRVVDRLTTAISFFGNDDILSDIRKDKKICQHEYKSMISGKVKISFFDLDELKKDDYKFTNSMYFYGERINISKFLREVRDKYKLVNVTSAGNSQKDVVVFIWICMIIILIVITVFEVLLRKKEMSLMLAFGEAAEKTVIKRILQEVVTELITFSICRIVIFKMLSGKFLFREEITIVLIGLIIESIVFLSLLFCNPLSVLANGSESTRILTVLYTIKIILFFLVVSGVGVGFEMVADNFDSLKDGSAQVSIGDYSYLEIYDEMGRTAYVDENEKSERLQWTESITNEIYSNYFNTAEPLLCTKVLEDNADYILTNSFGMIMFEKEKIESDKPVAIYIPDYLCNSNTKENLDVLFEAYNIPENIAEFIVYDTKMSIPFINSSGVSGISKSSDPVLICVNDRKLSEKINIESVFQDVLFKFDNDDIAMLEKAYNFSANGYRIIRTDYSDYYEYNSSFIRKVVKLVMSLAVVILILYIILIILITSIYFKANAMKISLMKIYGFGFTVRYLKVLILCIVPNLLLTVASVVYMYKIGKRTAVLSVTETGIFITFSELIVLSINVLISEKRNLIKVLKGGAL